MCQAFQARLGGGGGVRYQGTGTFPSSIGLSGIESDGNDDTRANNDLAKKLQEMGLSFCFKKQRGNDQSFVEEFKIQTFDDFCKLTKFQVHQAKTLLRWQKEKVDEFLLKILNEYLTSKLGFFDEIVVKLTHELKLQTFDDLTKLQDNSIDNAESLKPWAKRTLKQKLHQNFKFL